MKTAPGPTAWGRAPNSRRSGGDVPLPVVHAALVGMEDALRGLLGPAQVVAQDRVVNTLIQGHIRQLVVEDLARPLEVRCLTCLIGRGQGGGELLVPLRIREAHGV